MPDEPEAALPERRENLKLRTLFDEVYARIVPFLDPAQTWGGVSLQHFAFRTIREGYPELSAVEVHQLVVASVRVFRTRNPGRAGHLAGPEALVETM